MEPIISKRLPKILKINRIEKSKLIISVLFSNGEDRILDFAKILRKDWKVSKGDPEYKLLQPKEFAKVKIQGHTLSWNNVDLYITGLDGKKKKVAFEVGADTLFELSEMDEKLWISIGSMFKKARLAANLSQDDVAVLAGTSRTYITKLESGKQDLEVMTLKKLVEAGLNKHLSITIK
jgi:DNA-binding XRE family transcriptional regulator